MTLSLRSFASSDSLQAIREKSAAATPRYRFARRNMDNGLWIVGRVKRNSLTSGGELGVEKTKKFIAGAVCLALIGVAGGAWAGASTTFSASDLNGTYAEVFSGFVVGTGTQPTIDSPIPFGTATSFPESGTGTLVADGSGNFTATITSIIGGLVCAGTLAGGSGVSGGDGFATGYTVNPDGSGIARGIFTPFISPTTLPPQVVYGCPPAGGHQDEYFQIVNHHEVRFVSIDSDTTLSGTATLQR